MSNKSSGKGKNTSRGSGPRGKPSQRRGSVMLAAPRQPLSRRWALAGVVVVVVLVLVIAGVFYQRSRTSPGGTSAVAASTAPVRSPTVWCGSVPPPHR